MEKPFTLSYSQPSDYQFSLDSIQLAKHVVDQYRGHPRLQELRFLDLCCGCGVIGLEIYYFLREIQKFDFLEIQDVYQKHFESNLNLFHPRPSFLFYLDNYQSFSQSEKQGLYDVIVCNPPYFFSSEGVLSPSDFKNRCRFFLDASFQELIESICRLLSLGGEAYLLINRGEAYGKDRIKEAKAYLPHGFELEELGKIRITNLVKIKRLKLYSS